jgi:hypothetical protein
MSSINSFCETNSAIITIKFIDIIALECLHCQLPLRLTQSIEKYKIPSMSSFAPYLQARDCSSVLRRLDDDLRRE